MSQLQFQDERSLDGILYVWHASNRGIRVIEGIVCGRLHSFFLRTSALFCIDLSFAAPTAMQSIAHPSAATGPVEDGTTGDAKGGIDKVHGNEVTIIEIVRCIGL